MAEVSGARLPRDRDRYRTVALRPSGVAGRDINGESEGVLNPFECESFPLPHLTPLSDVKRSNEHRIEGPGAVLIRICWPRSSGSF